jgi:hypothetical protein
MTTITKLRNALAALTHSYHEDEAHPDTLKAITDLQAVIAEMEAGEPVAYVQSNEVHGSRATFIYRTDNTKHLPDGLKLYTHPQPKAEPVQCLDCGSNNVGVPANYDSVVDSVKTKGQEAEFMSEVAYEHVFKDGSKSLSYALSFAGFPPRNDADHVNLLYAAAPQAKPLITREQHFALREAFAIGAADSYFEAYPTHDNSVGRMIFERGFVRGFDSHERAIEAAHGIKP